MRVEARLTFEPLALTYDAAGRNAGSTQTFTLINESLLIEDTFEIVKTNTDDGNGRLVKESESATINGGTPTGGAKYALRSSVTGNTIVEYNGTGSKISAYIYIGGQMIARFTTGVVWQHNNPVVGDAVDAQSNSVVGERVTRDPTGVNTGDEAPPNTTPDWIQIGNYQQTGNPLDAQGGCLLWGFPIDCSILARNPCVGNPRCFNNGGRIGGDGYIDAFVDGITDVEGWIAAPPILSHPDVSQQPARPFEVPRISRALEVLLRNQKCRDFISQLLSKASAKTGQTLAEKGNVLKMFEIASKNLTRTRPKGATKSTGNPIGSFKKKNAGVFAMANSWLTDDQQFVADLVTILHELLHLAAFDGSYFTDQRFAEIIHDSPELKKIDNPANTWTPINPFDTSGWSTENREDLKKSGSAFWGQYWESFLKNNCLRDERGNFIDVASIR